MMAEESPILDENVCETFGAPGGRDESLVPGDPLICVGQAKTTC